jgi:PKHD-type hydroxylase
MDLAMHVILEKVLSQDDLAQIKALIDSETFVDGRESSTAVGKNNLQLPAGQQAAEVAGALVADRLAGSELFQLAVLPRHILTPMFSKYEVGMTYPEHVDNAVMDGCRTDMAVTVFLADPASYGGGELAVDTGNGMRRYRLPAGDAIVYPASTIHHVVPVTFGVRLAAVTWVQSMIRDGAKRAVLYDLGCALASLGDSHLGPRLRRSYQNLLRKWAET